MLCIPLNLLLSDHLGLEHAGELNGVGCKAVCVCVCTYLVEPASGFCISRPWLHFICIFLWGRLLAVSSHLSLALEHSLSPPVSEPCLENQLSVHLSFGYLLLPFCLPKEWYLPLLSAQK